MLNAASNSIQTAKTQVSDYVLELNRNWFVLAEGHAWNLNLNGQYFYMPHPREYNNIYDKPTYVNPTEWDNRLVADTNLGYYLLTPSINFNTNKIGIIHMGAWQSTAGWGNYYGSYDLQDVMTRAGGSSTSYYLYYPIAFRVGNPLAV